MPIYFYEDYQIYKQGGIEVKSYLKKRKNIFFFSLVNYIIFWNTLKQHENLDLVDLNIYIISKVEITNWKE